MALHWVLSSMSRSPLYWCEGLELDLAPQMWPHQCGAEGKDQSLSLLAIACQDAIGLLCSKGTMAKSRAKMAEWWWGPQEGWTHWESH